MFWVACMPEPRGSVDILISHQSLINLRRRSEFAHANTDIPVWRTSLADSGNLERNGPILIRKNGWNDLNDDVYRKTDLGIRREAFANDKDYIGTLTGR